MHSDLPQSDALNLNKSWTSQVISNNGPGSWSMAAFLTQSTVMKYDGWRVASENSMSTIRERCRSKSSCHCPNCSRTRWCRELSRYSIQTEMAKLILKVGTTHIEIPSNQRTHHSRFITLCVSGSCRRWFRAHLAYSWTMSWLPISKILRTAHCYWVLCISFRAMLEVACVQ